MSKIPFQLIKDYGIVCLTYICALLFLRPAFFGEYKITESLMVVAVVHAIVLFFAIAIGEGVVTFLFRSPFSYGDALLTRLQHFALCGAVSIPALMVLLTQANVIMMHGIEHADYAWHDGEGNFTLEWMLMSRSSCAVASFVIAIAMTALSELRQMRYVLQELFQINQMLEAEQKNLRLQQPMDNPANEIILHGDNRDSLTVNPQNIVYVESIANYLNIAYFNDTDLCTKRLRSSLRDMEEALEVFPYMVRTHRAFLVNIHFITQVTGNSAGMKVSLFSCDRVIPVSRSNIEEFKERVMIKA
ncbi:MAG: LytTR family transcriptional regulator [Bacteroidales bacterium]|nr:LytTR family transcriptional regulator [Candidatus Liminaster caballi]